MSMIIPAFSLPPVLARVGRHLPQWPHALALCLGLNAVARLQVLPADALVALEGKRFSVEVEDAGSCARFVVRNAVFWPDFSGVGADLRLSATLAVYLQLLNRQEDPDTLFFQRKLRIEGDTELGLRVKNILDAVDWDGAAARLPAGLRRLAGFSAEGGETGR